MATNNNINTGKPIEVIPGGTQNSSFTSYGVICGGTTSTGALQNIGTGSLGQILVSKGNAALPQWQNFEGDLKLIQTITVPYSSSVSSVAFSLPSTYANFVLVINNMRVDSSASSPNSLYMLLSTNGGASYLGSGYVTKQVIQPNFSSGGWVNSGITTTNSLRWNIMGQQSSSIEPSNGTFYLFNMNNSSTPAFVGINSRSQGSLCVAGGFYGSSINVNAIQISMASRGNIQVGTFSLYGIQQ